MRALLTPAETSDYTFWVSGDDNCELWLGSDRTEESRSRIAHVPGWTSAEQWDKYNEQESEPVRLLAGRSYFIEALMKEHGGGDSLSVAWSQSNGKPQVISGSFLSPLSLGNSPSTGLILDAGADVTQYAPNFTFHGNAQVIDLNYSWPTPELFWDLDEGRPVKIAGPELANPEITLSETGNYTFIVNASSKSGSTEDTVEVTLLPPLHPNAGSAITEYWFGVRGGIDGLADHPDFPSHPHRHQYISRLASSERIGDQYGARTRGQLLVPESGTYRFFVSGDDQVEFYLSSNESPDNRTLIASVEGAVGYGDYFANASQASQPIELEAGRQYAFEVLHQEEWSNDHFSVAWQMPGSDFATEITLEFIAPPEDSEIIASRSGELDLNLDYLVEAGRDQIIYLPQNSVALDGYQRKRLSGSDYIGESWSQVSGPTGVVITPANDDVAEAVFPGVGTYVLEYSVETSRNTSSDTLTVEVRPALTPDSGFLTREVWWYRNYSSIAAFRSDPDYPDHPDIVDSIPGMRQSSNWSSRYGARVTGLLHIPANETETNYRFYVSGDDAVEFSISTDETEANLQRACYATSPTGRDRWNTVPTQASYPLTLTPGRSYFVELLLKQTWGSDYFSVAWTNGDEQTPQLIDGSYFSPKTGSQPFDGDQNYYASAGRDRTYFWPHDATNLSGSLIKVQSTTNLPTVSWQQIAGATATIENPSDLNTAVTFPGVGDYTFQLTAQEGVFSHQDSVTIQIKEQQPNVSGFLTRSVWFDVSGRQVSDLLEVDPELRFPHFKDLFPGAETPQNWADYYGSRLSGFITVPESGNYKFWIASDDYSEIWLDRLDGSGPTRIADLRSSSGFRNWDRRTSQESGEMPLQADVAYPITILHKEYGGNDFLSVAMEGPATNGRELLSRGFLSPDQAAPIHNPEITVTCGVDRTLLWPNNELVIAALVYDLQDGPQSLSYQWSTQAPGVTFQSPSSPVTGISFPGPGVYEVKITASDGSNSAADSVFVTVNDPLVPNAGGILREAWVGIDGWRLSDLNSSEHYRDSPNFSDILPELEAPTNWADRYAQRFTGFLQVPVEGHYALLVASDDQSEVLFNPDGESSSEAYRVAFTDRATGQYRWDRYSTQKSDSFHLVPGQRYYLQALHKEGTGNDYFSLAYQRTDIEGSDPVIIPGPLLSPPAGANQDLFNGEIGISAGENQQSIWPRNRFDLTGTAIDYVPGPDLLAFRWTVTAAPNGAAGDVVFDLPTSSETAVEFPQPGSYTVQLTVTDGYATRHDSLRIEIDAPLADNTGSLLAEVYENISGSWVTNLVDSPKFPDAPDRRFQLKSTEIESNQDDSYGMLVRGYLYPPVTGIYRFNLASDDWSEFYISPDNLPENKEMACFVPAATQYYEWRKFPDYQLSRPIELTAGMAYYVEMRYKEHGYRDHLALAWLVPGGNAFEIIDGAYTSPWLLPDAAAPEVALNGGSEITLEVGNDFTDPGFLATDLVDGDVSDSVEVTGSVDTSTPGTYLVRYTVRDSSGNESAVHTRTINVVLAPGTDPTYPADSSNVQSDEQWTEPATLTAIEASRFLKQATFGPTAEEIARVQEIGIEAWIDEQLQLPQTSHLEQMDTVSRYQGARSQLLDLVSGKENSSLPGTMMDLPMSRIRTDDRLWTWWTSSITAPDQLRQRVAFALSEIMVISDKSPALRNYPRGVAHYNDILAQHAFGSYRDLIQDVTLNPMMGIWLTMVRSSKDQADENYPRELLQLFSIGLNHLNKDGSFKRDPSGNTIPTYGQDEVLGLSRAFTGWTFSGSQTFTWTGSNGIDEIKPMMAFEDFHDRSAKTILGGATLPAGFTASQDVNAALNIISDHPNVGTFMARRLIQRLVTSNPSPAYIYRVSSVFDDNGSGIRGDLGAVVKAILMDPEARQKPDLVLGGKLSEPIIRLSRLIRAFPKSPTSNPPVLGRFLLNNVGTSFGQSPIQANSVFNFFSPDHQEPGSMMDANLYSPEFEITTEVTTVNTANYFFDGARSGFAASVSRVKLDLEPLEQNWPSPHLLFQSIETLLLGRPMSTSMKNALSEVHSAYEQRHSEGVAAMIQIIAASPEFSVEQ